MVKVKPDETKISVFIKGILNVFKLWIPVGGQTRPISPAGLSEK